MINTDKNFASLFVKKNASLGLNKCKKIVSFLLFNIVSSSGNINILIDT